MEKNFLVDPTVINMRKTTKLEGGRIRDHKIQVSMILLKFICNIKVDSEW